MSAPALALVPMSPATAEAIRAAVDRAVSDALGEHAGKATISVEETAGVFGISRSSAYEACRRGELPSIRLGRSLRVPVAALTVMLLGVDPS